MLGADLEAASRHLSWQKALSRGDASWVDGFAGASVQSTSSAAFKRSPHQHENLDFRRTRSTGSFVGRVSQRTRSAGAFLHRLGSGARLLARLDRVASYTALPQFVPDDARKAMKRRPRAAVMPADMLVGGCGGVLAWGGSSSSTSAFWRGYTGDKASSSADPFAWRQQVGATAQRTLPRSRALQRIEHARALAAEIAQEDCGRSVVRSASRVSFDVPFDATNDTVEGFVDAEDPSGNETRDEGAADSSAAASGSTPPIAFSEWGWRRPPSAGGASLAVSTRTSLLYNKRRCAVTSLVPPPTSTVMWHGAFARYMDSDQEVHTDDLYQVLEQVGVASPKSEWMEEVLAELTHYSTLNFHEFCSFIEKYRDKEHDACLAAFQRFDADSSGEIDANELADVLRSLQITVMDHVLEELIAEVDDDDTGSLDIDEFVELMRNLEERHGFTTSEQESLLQAFKKFDVDNSDSVNAEELANMLAWLNYSLTPDDIKQVISQVDNGSGELNAKLFLLCMRKFREVEIQRITELLRRSDTTGAGVVSDLAQLEEVLRALGYNPDPEAVREAAEDSHLELPTASIGRLLQFVEVYRSREGFRRIEAEAIEQTFELIKGKEIEECIVEDVSTALRQLGSPVTKGMREVVRSLVSEVNMPPRSTLDWTQFKKLVRRLREWEFKHITRSLRNLCREHASSTVGLKCKEMLEYMACVDETGVLTNGLFDDLKEMGSDELTEACFPALAHKVLHHRFQHREDLQQYAGFHGDEVKALRHKFAAYDTDGSGEIEGEELGRLLSKVLPDMSSDPARRPELLRVLEEVDQDRNGRIDFKEFLRIMRRCQDIDETKLLAKEKEAIKKTGFSDQEVNEFRRIFVREDHAIQGKLTLNQVGSPLRQLLPPSQYDGRLFRSIFNTCVACDEDAEAAIFPEFLLIMWRIMEVDLGGVLSVSAGFARAQRESQQQQPQLQREYSRRNAVWRTSGTLSLPAAAH